MDELILFSDRKMIERAYNEWLKNNPEIKDCAFSVITFMVGCGLVKGRMRTDFYEQHSNRKKGKNESKI